MSDLSDYKRMVSEPYARHMQAAVAKLKAENARLAGQVAAIRALPDRYVNERAYCMEDDQERHQAIGYNEALATVRAALVASSPTTPEAPK